MKQLNLGKGLKYIKFIRYIDFNFLLRNLMLLMISHALLSRSNFDNLIIFELYFLFKLLSIYSKIFRKNLKFLTIKEKCQGFLHLIKIYRDMKFLRILILTFPFNLCNNKYLILKQEVFLAFMSKFFIIFNYNLIIFSKR